MHLYTAILVALLAACSVVTAYYPEPGRLGCYEDSSARVWKHWQNTHEKNTVQFCKNMCQDFAYAGVQAGRFCMCGDEIPPKMLPDSRCNSPCSGDPGVKCGGDWALEVYTVEPKPVIVGNPKGCFLDSSDRIWKTGLIRLQSNSPQRCFNACRGFKFAGLQAGFACFCGNNLPSTPLPKTRCQDECTGYPGKKCGGAWAMDVFALKETAEVPIPTSPTSPTSTSSTPTRPTPTRPGRPHWENVVNHLFPPSCL